MRIAKINAYLTTVKWNRHIFQPRKCFNSALLFCHGVCFLLVLPLFILLSSIFGLGIVDTSRVILSSALPRPIVSLFFKLWRDECEQRLFQLVHRIAKRVWSAKRTDGRSNVRNPSAQTAANTNTAMFKIVVAYSITLTSANTTGTCKSADPSVGSSQILNG